MKKSAALLLAVCLLAGMTVIAETYPTQTDVQLRIFTTIFSDNTSLGYTDCNERPIVRYINEASGVNAIWDTLVAGADHVQVLNTMTASGAIKDYDIIIANGIFTGSNAAQYIADDIIIPLNDYLDKVPNYTRFFEDMPTLDKKSRTPDGTYYGFFSMRQSAWANTWYGPLIRQDWLDELGLPMPKTFEDWDTVARAFKENYGAPFSGKLWYMRYEGLSGAFNARGTFWRTLYIDDDGAIQLGQVQPEWKEYIRALNGWYEDGLIDPDILTNDDSAVRAKALNGETGFIIMALSDVDLLNNQAKEIGSSALWVGCPYPANDEGVIGWPQGNSDLAAENYSAVITTGCDEAKLPVALNWINWAYGDDGILTFNYGKEGETFDIIDGVPTYKDSVLHSDETIDSAMKRITGTAGQYWPVQAEGLVRAKNSPGACAAVDAWVSDTSQMSRRVPSGLSFTEDESYIISEIDTALTTYINEQSLKFFTSARSLDEIDAFFEELKQIGLDQYLEIYQTALDRYNAY